MRSKFIWPRSDFLIKSALTLFYFTALNTIDNSAAAQTVETTIAKQELDSNCTTEPESNQSNCIDLEVKSTAKPDTTTIVLNNRIDSIAQFSFQANKLKEISILSPFAQVPTGPAPQLPPFENRDRFPQPAPDANPLPPDTTRPVQPPPPPENQPPDTPNTIFIKKINVVGSTILKESDLNPITQPLEGKNVTFNDLRQVQDQITQLYLNKGFITSRAIIVEQAVSDGIIEIRVLEGTLEEILVEGNGRLNSKYIISRIKLGAGKPLNANKLEEQLRLLQADPLFKNVEAGLRPGSDATKSKLIVRVTLDKSFYASVSADNYSPPTVGSERVGVGAGYRNLTGFGDEIGFSYYHSTTGGADIGDFFYRVPLNAKNGTLQFRAAPNRNRITQAPFSILDIKGRSELFEVSFRQPLIRSTRQEFALSLAFTYQSNETFLGDNRFTFGIGPENGVTRNSIFRFGQDYVRRDRLGAWSVRSLFSFGTGLLDATINDESFVPSAKFFTWLGQIQRVQVINPNNFLIIQGNLQLTPDPLFSSQQFVMGGGQSVRGYRQNVRSGDNGFTLTIEDRITLFRNQGNPVLTVAPFVDLGSVWNAKNINLLPEQTFLAGAGLGLIFNPWPALTIRLDYGVPLVNLRDRGINAQDDGFYFNVNYRL